MSDIVERLIAASERARVAAINGVRTGPSDDERDRLAALQRERNEAGDQTFACLAVLHANSACVEYEPCGICDLLKRHRAAVEACEK